MSYYIAKQFDGADFDATIDKVKAALADAGFGVLTEIDIKATLKKKLDADFHDYVILGACMPQLAFKALSAEDKIGTMLPCNVIVQKQGAVVEVAAVDPVASMMAVKNEGLAPIAADVRARLAGVIDGL